MIYLIRGVWAYDDIVAYLSINEGEVSMRMNRARATTFDDNIDSYEATVIAHLGKISDDIEKVDLYDIDELVNL